MLWLYNRSRSVKFGCGLVRISFLEKRSGQAKVFSFKLIDNKSEFICALGILENIIFTSMKSAL
jgi:hypothetical protein